MKLISRISLFLVIAVLSLTALPAQATSYEYDSLNRLTKVIYDNGVTVVYIYDKAGNRTAKRVVKE